MFGRFRNEAAGAAPIGSTSGLIQGPISPNVSDGTTSDQPHRLTKRARERSRRLRRRYDDAVDLGRSLTDRIMVANEDRQVAAARLQQCGEYTRGYIGAAANHHALKHAQNELDAAQRKLEEIDERLAELKVRAEAASATRNTLGRLLRAIDAGLAALPPEVRIKDAAPVTPELRRGESLPAAVERMRKELEKALALRAKVAAAPLVFAEARELVQKQLAALAERGKPDLFGTIEAGLPVGWAQSPVVVSLQGGFAMPNGDAPGHVIAGNGRAEVLDAAALLCWLFQGQIAKRLEEDLRQSCEGNEGLSSSDRARKLLEIDQQILQLEREEAELVEQSDGTILPRETCDWRALVAVEAPAARAKS